MIFLFLGDMLIVVNNVNIKGFRVCGAVVAQLTLNQLVVGSNPTAPTIKIQRLTIASFLIPNLQHCAGLRRFKRISLL